ncbi:hypothetical protein FOA43_002780 [Brettanomyces nanus]|uniref:Major facilitator superfamily (MFS) profile domain-containing protein n=1 Tax=Eeniella nana TaxID=13502 RepID=A0A875S253_EENNA|nr:uncharacterized protein FOA43_002780 [Brettanomyces nanus]QPG75426.1 hypothetical protein FOA43_002780 [Brettanomyces nanus]
MNPEDIPKAPLVGRPLLVFTSFFVSISVFLMGYDQGYFSSILTNEHFKNYFEDPNAVQIGTVVAVLEIGALITSLTLGYVADRFGRRKTTQLGCVLFCFGGVVQTASTSFHHLGIGRFISGLGVGYLSGTAPTYMSEIASSDMRGLLGSAQFTGNVFGYSTSIWIDYACSYLDSNYSFRIPLGIQVCFGLILFFGTFVLVESPRWLLEHDHDTEGLIVLADLFAEGQVHDTLAVESYKSIKESVLIGRLEGELSYIEAIKRYPKRIFIGCSAQLFAQFNGINVISYYAPLVFEEAGWTGRGAILMTGFNSILYLFSTLIPWRLSETWGRKPLLIMGGLGMGAALIMVAIFTSLKYSVLVVIGVMWFNTSFGTSWGPIGWLIGPEVLPNKARASGAALATSTNWFCNFVVGEMAPILLELISWRLYLIHAACCFISAITVWKMYPETKGLSLEDMDSIFDDASSYSSSVTSSTSRISHTINDIESLGSRHNRAHMARSQPQTQSGTYNERSPVLDSRTSSFMTMPLPQGSGVISSSAPFILPQDIEPPDLEAVYKYKTDDSRSIRGSLRRGSEAVSSIFKFGKKKDPPNDGVTTDDDVSERFIS